MVKTQRPARPRRGRVSRRAEVDVPAEGSSRPDLPVRQRRRERAGHVQQSHPDGGGSAPGARRHHPQLLRHAGRRRPTSTCATSIRWRYQRLQAAIDECYAAGYLGKNILGSGLLARHLSASRGGGLHLRRRDRADRKPGRQAGLAADQAAVSRPSKALFRKPTVVNNIETRGLRHAHRRPRRRVVQVDRRAARSEQSARSGQLRPEALLPQRPRQQAGLLRSAAGRHLPRADRRVRRRRLEGPQGEGRRCPAASAWAC